MPPFYITSFVLIGKVKIKFENTLLEINLISIFATWFDWITFFNHFIILYHTFKILLKNIIFIVLWFHLFCDKMSTNMTLSPVKIYDNVENMMKKKLDARTNANTESCRKLWCKADVSTCSSWSNIILTPSQSYPDCCCVPVKGAKLTQSNERQETASIDQ